MAMAALLELLKHLLIEKYRDPSTTGLSNVVLPFHPDQALDVSTYRVLAVRESKSSKKE